MLPGDMTNRESVEARQTMLFPAELPPSQLHPAQWWHRERERLVCDLCPRHCSLKDGDAGFCFVRQNVGGEMKLATYGHSTGFCIDPVEKKPLNHFYPGSAVLSFGTAGCNLGCRFCQAWEITKSRDVLNRLSQHATPEMIAQAAVELDCRSVAFTYNDPVVWAEYAIDTANACHKRGVKTIAVTAGYICEEARQPFFEVMDAANVDLKGFTEEFYRKYTLSHLQPVLDTLKWLARETDVWLELTTLLIPGANDSLPDIRRMCEWIRDTLGDEVPLHFTAFHPDYRMLDTPRTPLETLVTARDTALEVGLKYVYIGNVSDPAREATYCPGCGQPVIRRRWYDISDFQIRDGSCITCGTAIAGQFNNSADYWGTRRQPVDPASLLKHMAASALS